MAANILPAAGAADGASLIVRLRDTVKAVKVHRNRLADLSRHCDSLLSTVKEYAPLLVGTQAGTEADAIERAVERILRRVSGWAGLSDTAAFLRQNEIQAGIEECHRELTACSDKFNMALGIMTNIENQMQHLAQQRDHRELVDMIAFFLEEVRKYSRLLASEAPQLSEPLVQSQVLEVDEGQTTLPVVSTPGPSRPKSADMSGKVSKVSDQVIIKGSLLDFYPGEWTDDGDPTALGRLRYQSAASQKRFKERIEASLGLQHRNVLSFFGHITIEDIVYSVNPWMENGNIREYIRRNPDADRMRLLGEVASGVEFLHEREIVHGDICGKNILINGEGKAVVCGFGLTECSNPNLDISRARWFAPEKITSANVTLPTEKGDSWSFGSLCLEVFTGEDPYSSSSDLYVPVLLSQGTAPEHPGSKAVGLSPSIWELMQSCWKIDPVERPSMYTIRSTIRPPRDGRHPSGSSEPPTPSSVPPTNDATVPDEASYHSAESSSTSPSRRSPLLTGIMPLRPREPSLTLPVPPIGTFDHQTEIEGQTGHFRKASDGPSTVSGRLPPLLEVPVNSNIPAPLPSPSQFPSVSGKRSPRPSTAPSPSTPFAPSPSPPLLPSDLRRKFSVDSSSSQSTSSTGDSGPRRRWPFKGPKRSQTTPNTTPDATDDSLPPLPPSIPSGDNSSVHQTAPQRAKPPPTRAQTSPTKVRKNSVAPQASRSASLLVPLPESRKWEPMSPAVLGFLKKVASDPESFLRPGADGSVSAGNLEGLVSRVISGTADKVKDARYMATFLTVYQLFATSERLLEILQRRFGSTELDPAHIRSRFNILLFIESWIKKGFEDEELKHSEKIKKFVLSIRGSGTMEAKTQEIASLMDKPGCIRLRQPGSSARLERERRERPQEMTATDLAAALTVVEGDRFRCITFWDYVNFTRENSRRIEVFNTVHDLITVWVKKTVLHSDDLGERMKKYDEWILAAQACRANYNFSSAAAIVIALTSSEVASLAMTCESKVRSILHGLARELSPTDDVYQNTLQQTTTTTKELIPWLDPLLSSLTFTCKDPIVEVDGHPLVDFRKCTTLAEQIDSLVQYSPPRACPPPDVLSYVEVSLKSCAGDNVLRDTEVRHAQLVKEEQALLDRRERMRLLGMAWSPHPRRK